MKAPKINGPIPGENFTSDTKNYPWHRPPQFTDYDDAIDFAIDQISEEESIELILSLLEVGVDCATMTSIILLNMISQGRFSIDLALLIAGPIARYIQIMAEAQGVTVDMGTGRTKPPLTATRLRMLAGLVDDTAGSSGMDAEPPPEPAQDTAPPTGGFLRAPEPAPVEDEEEVGR